MPNIRVLYVASEIYPFLNTSSAARLVNNLVLAMQEKKIEIRILVPKFGIINERKNRLHEVVRLSGVSIEVGKEEHVLTVKVASIPGSRCQVYFIDNHDFFHRRAIFTDCKNNFFKDNGNRLIFFCKGALETVKNLEWAPDVVHCHDWMTSLIPFYLKTTYQNDLILKSTKTLYTVYNNALIPKMEKHFRDGTIKTEIQSDKISLPDNGSLGELIQTGIQYADTVVRSEVLDKNSLTEYFEGVSIPYITDDAQGIEAYYKLYNELTESKL